MRKVEFEQGSDVWLEWRKGRITATDAAAILGESPYVTAFKCWQRKTGQAPEAVVTAPMMRGRIDEPRARKMFIEQYGINMTPVCVESEDYDYIGASLDGISDCGRYILEIKSQNLLPIKTLGVPAFHMHQIQHQMLCGGEGEHSIEKCFYVSIWGDEIYVIEVSRDLFWADKYLPKAKEFWKGVILLDAPPMVNKDYIDLSEDLQWKSLTSEYKKISEQIKNLEEVQASYRQALIKMCGENSCLGNGLKVMKKSSGGRIDYEKACEKYSINQQMLDEFRKPKTFSWTITLDKCKEAY